MKHRIKIKKLISHNKVSKEKQTGDREEEAQDLKKRLSRTKNKWAETDSASMSIW